MTPGESFRRERIEKLLHELKYEVERGVVAEEISERMGFDFIVPTSREGAGYVVLCRFRLEPVRHDRVLATTAFNAEPRLRVIEGGKE